MREAREQRQEAVAFAEDHARPVHRPRERRRGDERLGLPLRAQVARRPRRIGVERAHVQEARHAARATRRDRVAGELDVDAREAVAARFVEDADQVDDRVRAAHQRGQASGVVDVGLDDVDGRQQDQVPGALAAARRHDGLVAGGHEPRGERAAHEAAAPEHDDAQAGHARHSLAASGVAAAGRGPTVPSRWRISTAASPNARA